MGIEVVAGKMASGKTTYIQNKLNRILVKDKGTDIIILDSIGEYVKWAEETENQIVEVDLRRNPNIFAFKPTKGISAEQYEIEFTEHLLDLQFMILFKCLVSGQSSPRLDAEKYKAEVLDVLEELYRRVGVTRKNFSGNLDAVDDISYDDFLSVAADILKDESLIYLLEERQREFVAENLLEEIFIYGKSLELPALNQRVSVIIDNCYGDYQDKSIVRLLAHLRKEIRRKLSEKKKVVVVVEERYTINKYVKNLLLTRLIKETDILVSCQDLKRFEFHYEGMMNKINNYYILEPSTVFRSQLGSEIAPEWFENGPVRIENGVYKKPKKRREPKKLLKKAMWKFNMSMYRSRYPGMGYYERMCRVAGYSKETIDEMVEEAVKDKLYEEDDPDIRELVCEEEVGYWEE